MEEKGFSERMFEDIGEKIKGLAKFSCWVGIIASIIIAIVSFVQASDSYAKELQIMLGWGFLVIGPIVSWISSWTLYGFGELIEKTTYIECHLCSQNEREEDKIKNTNEPVEQKFKCTKCDGDVFFGETECKNCGQRFDWNKL